MGVEAVEFGMVSFVQETDIHRRCRGLYYNNLNDDVLLLHSSYNFHLSIPFMDME